MEQPNKGAHHHHILPYKTAFAIGGSLIFLTGVTVWVGNIDLGKFNFVIAMLIATLKASLVALFFMNLKYDRKENAVIFGTSFLFLAIFISLTVTDLFFRGDVYVKGPLAAPAAQGKSKFKKPWIATPELVSHGRELFMVQCIACHGPEGKGDGPAASALNPHPRNFTQDVGWKNGRKPSQVFKTLKEGVPGSAMASFATLPQDDRWALASYVLSLGPSHPQDSPADLAKIGINPNDENGGGAAEAPTVPIEIAMDQLATDSDIKLSSDEPAPPAKTLGSQLYQQNCLNCHGAHGQGGIKVRNLGVNPRAFLVTRAFSAAEEIRSPDSFSKILMHGLPGNLMPSYGNFSSSEMHELYQYAKSLSGH